MWAKFKDALRSNGTKHMVQLTAERCQVTGYVFKLQNVNKYSRNLHKLKFSVKYY